VCVCVCVCMYAVCVCVCAHVCTCLCLCMCVFLCCQVCIQYERDGGGRVDGQWSACICTHEKKRHLKIHLFFRQNRYLLGLLCDMTRSYVRHASYLCHDSLCLTICAPARVHIRAVVSICMHCQNEHAGHRRENEIWGGINEYAP